MSVHSSDVGLCKAKVFRLFFFNFFDGVEIFIFTSQFLDYDKFRLLFKYETHFWIATLDKKLNLSLGSRVSHNF